MPDALTAPLRTLAEVEAKLTRYTVWYLDRSGDDLEHVVVWATDPLRARYRAWEPGTLRGCRVTAVLPDGVLYGTRAPGALYFDSMGRPEIAAAVCGSGQGERPAGDCR